MPDLEKIRTDALPPHGRPQLVRAVFGRDAIRLCPVSIIPLHRQRR
jgi:hypothetical protein